MPEIVESCAFQERVSVIACLVYEGRCGQFTFLMDSAASKFTELWQKYAHIKVHIKVHMKVRAHKSARTLPRHKEDEDTYEHAMKQPTTVSFKSIDAMQLSEVEPQKASLLL